MLQPKYMWVIMNDLRSTLISEAGIVFQQVAFLYQKPWNLPASDLDPSIVWIKYVEALGCHITAETKLDFQQTDLESAMMKGIVDDDDIGFSDDIVGDFGPEKQKSRDIFAEAVSTRTRVSLLYLLLCSINATSWQSMKGKPRYKKQYQMRLGDR